VVTGKWRLQPDWLMEWYKEQREKRSNEENEQGDGKS